MNSTQRVVELKTDLTQLADQYHGLLATLGYVHGDEEITKVEFGNMKKPRHAGDIPLKFTINKRNKEEHTLH